MVEKAQKAEAQARAVASDTTARAKSLMGCIGRSTLHDTWVRVQGLTADWHGGAELLAIPLLDSGGLLHLSPHNIDSVYEPTDGNDSVAVNEEVTMAVIPYPGSDDVTLTLRRIVTIRNVRTRKS